MASQGQIKVKKRGRTTKNQPTLKRNNVGMSVIEQRNKKVKVEVQEYEADFS